MTTFQADTSNFVVMLQIVRDGDEICLTDGEYKGQFNIERAITIRGTGANTVIFAADEPALVIKVPGVRLENLAIERTVGGDTGEVVLLAEPGTSPVLKQVRLGGAAPNVKWEGGRWKLPPAFDFVEVETNCQVRRSLPLELGAPCKVLCELNWLEVQPSHLSQGPQDLDIVLNSTDITPGTVLSGSIFLEAPDGRREIAIKAKIKAPQPALTRNKLLIQKIQETTNDNDFEDWGYKFRGKVIEHLLRNIEGKDPLKAYPDFYERQERANELMVDLFGREPCLFYVRRKEPNRDYPEQEIWELTLATDRDDVQLPIRLEECEKTLWLKASVRSEDGVGGLTLLSIHLLPLERGQVDGFAVPCRLRLLPDRIYQIGVPPSALTRMAKQPICDGRHAPTEDQLQAWKAFLEIEERIAKTRQFCVSFVRNNYGVTSRKIAFEIDVTSASIDGSPENALNLDDFWERAVRAYNQEIMLFESSDDAIGGEDGKKLGNITDVDSERSLIRVRLNSDIVERISEELYQLPATGFLSFKAAGDLIQINRKQRALEDLQRGNTQNAYLGEFLFDTSKARPAQETFKLQPEDLLLRDANSDQVAAVAAVLAAPDIALIQGPPGTGKTTVIAEICYQVALQGGRTLIASQANLAVDNALSRLVHNPAIRALRKGKADKVDEEGLPFLEDRVIGTWLQNTRVACDKRLSERLKNVQDLRKLLAHQERFTAYLTAEHAFEPRRKQLQNQRASLEPDYQAKVSAHAEAEAQQRQVESLNAALEAMLASASSVNWEDSAVVDLLQRLKSYTVDTSLVEDCAAKVHEAINLASELGFASPSEQPLGLAALGLAAWLRDALPAWLTKTHTVVDYANNAIAAMAEAKAAKLSLTQKSGSLARLKTTRRRVIESQQSQRQEIENLHKRTSEINFALSELEKWSYTDNPSVHDTFKQCLQNSQPFAIIQRARLGDIEPVLDRITVEAINGIVKGGRTWLNQAQAETSQQLRQHEEQLNEQMRIAADQQQQISAVQEQVETSRRDADLKLDRVIELLQKLAQLPQMPENLRILAEQYSHTPSDILEGAAQFSARVGSWQSRTTQLETLISSLDPFAVLSSFRDAIAFEIASSRKATETALSKLQEFQKQLDAIDARLQGQLNHLNGERNWWQELWKTIPNTSNSDLFNLDFLRSVKAQFKAWQGELTQEEAYLNRYQHLVQDWIARLGNPSDQERNELRRIYLDNANVIGITCVQAKEYSFSKEFKNFDVVIIDEVSKCTPPELLIPALKGKKIVLIGDYRQLPPMLSESTIEDIAEEMGSTPDDLGFLKESLFKSQFEAAPKSIKRTLNMQYRMHPIIMGAINQFYDHRLTCGIREPDKKRAHNLAGSLIREEHHLIWVKMPAGQGFEEEKEGTSRLNVREVDVIERLCEQMEQAWVSKVAEGKPRKEIGIITFYGAQLRLIEERLAPGLFPSLHIRTGTVDRFQGMERQVIIVSMVCNNRKKDVGFAKKPERVNVAFSRAQELLVVVGCHSLFTQYAIGVGSMYSNISDIVRHHGGLVDVSSILS